MPVHISLAAEATTSGVNKFKVPSWSSGPKRPQAFPRGPIGSKGRSSKAKLAVSCSMALFTPVEDFQARAGEQGERSNLLTFKTQSGYTYACITSAALPSELYETYFSE